MNGHREEQQPAHFILVPLMAQGHTIPMIDMAHLLAGRGAHVTLVTTPANAARIRSVIDRARSLALPIHFLPLPFPSSAAGLPAGCENVDQITDPDHYLPFFNSLPLLRGPLELHLRGATPPPTCIVSDNCLWWTAATARELGVPRFVFHGPACFYLAACHNIRKHDVYGRVGGDHERVVVPGLPHEVHITRAQEPGSWFATPGWEEIGENVAEAERTADGVLVNTFHELEPEYVECYKEEVRPRLVLPIGPMHLHTKSPAARGNKAAVGKHEILGWLDSREPGSVLYVSFGSLAHAPPSQLVELGRGLEATGRPFVWVVKEAERSEKLDEWMLVSGFAGRTEGRGLVITGWAPQVLILSHPAVGGFLTHCGWNSVLEAVSAGLPMATWPHFADQFLNERLLVDVLGIGVAVGVTLPSTPIPVAADGVAVKEEEIAAAVSRLMDGGGEGEERRKRARELGERASKAMDEGGSSYENVSFLIEYVTKLARKNVDICT